MKDKPIIQSKMDVAPNAFVSFHMIIWFFRKYLQFIHLVQSVLDFSVNTTQQVVSLFFDTVKWSIHPFKAIKQIRGLVPFDASARAYADKRPVSTWLKSKALELSSGINAVPIHAQESETAIVEFVGSIDVNRILENLSKVPQKIFPCFNANDEDSEIEAMSSPEPEGDEKRHHFRNWKLPSISLMFAGFNPTKFPEEEDVSSLYNEKSRPVSKPEKTVEIGEGATVAQNLDNGSSRPASNGVSDEPVAKVSDPVAATTGPDSKSLWGGRRRKRRSSAGNT